MSQLKVYLKEKKNILENWLGNYFAQQKICSSHLKKSIEYSLMAGGKRLRPILVLASYECFDSDSSKIIPAAAAIEMIHSYSLIHDDLPAMDDDKLRRGQATNHIVFGEATAILAGDALLTEAFTLLSSSDWQISAENKMKVIHCLSKASGSLGMVAGQALDLSSEGKKIDSEQLSQIHRHKTGALLQASTEMGALLADANTESIKKLKDYGAKIGLAFQIVDDILDIEGGENLGKDLGSDLDKNKATYPALLGLEKSKQLAQELIHDSLESIAIFGEKAWALRGIANYVIARQV